MPVTDFIREVATSHDEALEICFRHGLTCRKRAWGECGQPTRLDLKERRFL